MITRAFAIFAGLLIGASAVRANEKAVFENLTCDIPDGWALQVSPPNMVRYAAPKAVEVNGQKQKLMLIIGKTPTKTPNLDDFKKAIETQADGKLNAPACEIIEQAGRKLMKMVFSAQDQSNPGTSLHYIEANNDKFMLIAGPSKLFNENKDAIEKALKSFEIKDAEQVAPSNGG